MEWRSEDKRRRRETLMNSASVVESGSTIYSVEKLSSVHEVFSPYPTWNPVNTVEWWGRKHEIVRRTDHRQFQECSSGQKHILHTLASGIPIRKKDSLTPPSPSPFLFFWRTRGKCHWHDCWSCGGHCQLFQRPLPSYRFVASVTQRTWKWGRAGRWHFYSLGF